MIKLNLFDGLFGAGAHDVSIAGHFVSGNATIATQRVAVIGTWDAAALDIELALNISRAVLAVVAEDTKNKVQPRPIVFIADTQGQELARGQELLGLNGYFAHVARSVDLARRQGHRTLTIIHGQAVSGGFLAFGLLADRICALPGAEVRVMDLMAMSRVTKIPFEKLQELAKESPVFAPGAENYWGMGAVHEIWPESNSGWHTHVAQALALAQTDAQIDQRASLGAERGGRTLSAKVSKVVRDA